MCGPNTVWDPEAITCNHPYAVNREMCRNHVEPPQSTSPSNCTDCNSQTGSTPEGTTSGTDQTTPGSTITDNSTPGSTLTESTPSNIYTESTTSPSTITDGSTPGTTLTESTSGTDGNTQGTGTDSTTPGAGTTSGTDGTPSGTGTTGGTDGTTPGGESTTTDLTPSTTAPCPIGQLEGDQIALVCPTGFKRHPKYCNLFYQCTENTHKILVLSCPEGTIYDDKKIQCLPQNETSPCNGQIAQSSFYKRLNDNSLPPVSITIKFNIRCHQFLFIDPCQQSANSLSERRFPRN